MTPQPPESPPGPIMPDFNAGRPADLWEAAKKVNAVMWNRYLTRRRQALPEPTVQIHMNMQMHYQRQAGEQE